MIARYLHAVAVAALAGLAACAGQNEDAGAGAAATPPRKAKPVAKRPRPALNPAATTGAIGATSKAAKPADRAASAGPPAKANDRPSDRPGGEADLAELPDHDRAKDERDRQSRVEKRRREARKHLRQVRRENDRERSKFTASLTSSQLGALRRFRSRLARREQSYLAPFHRRLRAFARGDGKRLVVLQIGDSHTASDNFSGYLRERLQRRFGNGGRGMLSAGVPYRYFQPFRVRVTQSGGWTVQSSRRKDDRGPFGINGYLVESDSAEEVITLSMRGTETFQTVEIEYLAGRKGGSFTVQVNKQVIRTISTRSRRPGMARAVIQAPRGAWFIAIRPKGDGMVRLLSWSTYKRRGGLVYVNHGVSGETIDILERWDPNIARWQLEHLNPALIMVAFGTNEGFDHKLKLDEYRDRFEARLRDLRAWAPNATIVLVGAPDAARLPSWCARSRSWRRRKALREKAECSRLKESHAARYERLIDKKSKALCYWHPPPMLAKIRQVHFRTARKMGLYYWAWSRVMGGQCGADRWARKDTPLAYADRVHMTAAGYDVSAQAFYEALMKDYNRR